MFPLHCVIESIDSEQCVNCSDATVAKQTLMDSYAIISGDTAICALVDTVLTTLGLHDVKESAKGKIILKNWKPLSFNEITDDANATVSNLFKELGNQITLNILTNQRNKPKQPETTSESALHIEEAKDALLRASVSQAPNLLTAIDDPAVKAFAEELIQPDAVPIRNNFEPQTIQKFIQWCSRQSRHEPEPRPRSEPTAPSQVIKFNHFLELPKLERWFAENANPSRVRLLQFLHILNSSNFRKHSQKVSLQQLSNWFTTARTIKQQNIGGSVPPQNLSTNQFPPAGLDFQHLLRLAAASHAEQIPDTGVSTSSVLHPNTIFSQTAPGGYIVGRTGGVSIMNRHKHIRQGKLPLSQENSGSANAQGSFAHDMGVHDQTNEIIDIGKIKSEGGSDEVNPQHITSAVDHVLRDLASSDTSDYRLAPTPSPGSTPGCSDSSIIKPEQGLDTSPGGSEVHVSVSQSPSPPIDVKREIGDEICHDVPHRTDSKELSPTHQSNPRFDCSNHMAGVPPVKDETDEMNREEISGQSQVHRTRLMFDPLSEIPFLEKWFENNAHPSWLQIDQFTETLNSMAYRQTYPPVTSYNVKIWFKNRRAKNKRLTLNAGNTLVPRAVPEFSLQGEMFNM